jgi:hydroxymethylpyrimidine pyrophosphatase-like HAD family hydrolase
VLDLDFTLAPLREPIPDELLDLLFKLNAQGIDICILTGAMEEIVEWRVLSRIREYEGKVGKFDWEKFYLCTNTGASGYRFQGGKMIRIFHEKFNEEQMLRVKEAVAKFKQRYGEDSITEVYVKPSKYSMYFKDTGKDPISEYVAFFENELKDFGVNISSGGNRESIDLTVSDKGEAIRRIQRLLMVRDEEIMGLGDSFADPFSNDRPMACGKFLIFNVGERASEDLKGKVYDLDDYCPEIPRGHPRTKLLLRLLLDAF